MSYAISNVSKQCCRTLLEAEDEHKNDATTYTDLVVKKENIEKKPPIGHETASRTMLSFTMFTNPLMTQGRYLNMSYAISNLSKRSCHTLFSSEDKHESDATTLAET